MRITLWVAILIMAASCSKYSTEGTFIGCEINGEQYWSDGPEACLISTFIDAKGYITVRDIETYSRNHHVYAGISNHNKNEPSSYAIHFGVSWKESDAVIGKEIPITDLSGTPEPFFAFARFELIGSGYELVSGTIVIDKFEKDADKTLLEASFEIDCTDSEGNPVEIRKGRLMARGQAAWLAQSKYDEMYGRWPYFDYWP